MTLPLVLAKLWSVMPKLFQRPVVSSFAGALERISLLALVGSVLVEFATGILYVDDCSRWSFNFGTVHYYGAWVFGAMFVLHACVKLPTVRRAYRERGVLKPLLQGLPQTAAEPPVAGGLAPVNPAAPTVSRRGLLAMVGGASLTIFAVEAGQSIGGSFRGLALLAPRGRVFGTGPNDFPVTHTAATAQITSADDRSGLAPDGRRWTDDVADAAATPRDGSDDAHADDHLYRGMVDDAALDRCASRRSGQVGRCTEGRHLDCGLAGGGREASFSESQFTDDRALLALRVNGADLSPDHGYPARVILPNMPGNRNTKWVRELRFEAA